MQEQYRTWAAVSKTALRQNADTIRGMIPPKTKIMGIVKADGYGHGAVEVARTLGDKIDWLGVAALEEAVTLRQAGIKLPILILGYTPPVEASRLQEYTVTQTVYSSEYAQALSAAACAADVTLDCHVKIDTGMNRLGFAAWQQREQDCAQQIQAAAALKGLRFTGCFTHFARADEDNAEATAFTQTQYKVFREVLRLLEEMGLEFPLRHCCNSAGILRYGEYALDMVRPGIILYGIPPSPDCQNQCKGLTPAMGLYTRVAMTKMVPQNAAVSYGGIYTTECEGEQLATIGMGYADGLRRSASSSGVVLIHGQPASIVGRVCMDQCVVKVTAEERVQQGDVVTLVGTDGGRSLTFQDWAEINGTIPYEEVCLIGKRVPRIYK